MSVRGWIASIAPTRRLAVAIAVIAPLWMFSGSFSGHVVALTALIVLAAAVILDVAFAASGLTVERDFPASVGVGDEVRAGYRLRSAAQQPVRVTWYHRLPPAVERVDDSLAQPVTLAPGGEAAIPIIIAGRSRGRHALGPLALRVAGPLGLMDRIVRFAPDDSITVTPSLAPVRRYRLLALQHRLRDAGIRPIRRRGEGTSFKGLREYTVGDDPRHVDWKASARRRKLITREFSVEQGQTVVITIDAGRLMTQFAGPLPRFEYALSSALVLADVAVHSGDDVGLLLFNDEVRVWVPPSRGATAIQRMRQALVSVEATMTEPDYAAAFRTLATRHRKRSLIVLFTDVVDVRSSQAMIAHTTRGAARHLPLVVALRNDALLDAALPLTAGRASSSGLYESASAEELILARDEALARMRRAGVSVVDVSPHTMTAAVVNRYLEIKARAAL